MANLAAIAKATRMGEAAQRAAASWGFKVADLEAQEARYRAAEKGARLLGHANRAADFSAALGGVLVALDKARKARRAAHTRWTTAQSILAANPLPGDPA